MEQGTRTAAFAVAVTALLVAVGALSYIYMADGNRPYSGSEPAPDFTYSAVNGGTVSLSGLRGNVVVLDFMAVWCQPCKDQIIDLKTIHGEYSERGVTVISVNVDLQVSSQELLEYRNGLGATWDFVTDRNGISMKPEYSVKSIPTIVIIDRDGAIAVRNVGLMNTSALRAAIDPLL